MTEQEQTEIYLDRAMNLLILAYENCNLYNQLKEQIEQLLLGTDNYQYLSK